MILSLAIYNKHMMFCPFQEGTGKTLSLGRLRIVSVLILLGISFLSCSCHMGYLNITNFYFKVHFKQCPYQSHFPRGPFPFYCRGYSSQEWFPSGFARPQPPISLGFEHIVCSDQLYLFSKLGWSEELHTMLSGSDPGKAWLLGYSLSHGSEMTLVYWLRVSALTQLCFLSLCEIHTMTKFYSWLNMLLC